MNFGETLTYWYLRLNGFFPIVGFVVHSNDAVRYSADTDLLAVRFPNVREAVGGQADDWDRSTFAQWGLCLDGSVLGLIVEVKTGLHANRETQRSGTFFSEERTRYAVERLGFWTDADKAVEGLRNSPTYHHGAYSVGKLLVTEDGAAANSGTPYLTLSLADTVRFLEDRVERYVANKRRDCLRFQSDLVQFIVWKRSLNSTEPRPAT